MTIKVYSRLWAAIWAIVGAYPLCVSIDLYLTRDVVGGTPWLAIILLLLMSLAFLPVFLQAIRTSSEDVVLTSEGISYKPLNNPENSLFIEWSQVHSVWPGWKKGIALSLKLKYTLDKDIPNNTVFKKDGDELHLRGRYIFVQRLKIEEYISNGISKTENT